MKNAKKSEGFPDSHYLSQSQTTLLAFKGTKKLHIYDRKDIQDDLLTQFNETIAFIEKHLNVRSEIKGLNRTDIYELPLEAIREAVVNALMHRDYSVKGSQISVEIYDARIEIINPGGLPSGLQKKAFGTISIRRNQIISDLFFRLHKVERIGMGIQRMKEAMAEEGLKEPVFETDGFFRAIFYRSQDFSLKGYGEPEGSQKGSQKSSHKILEWIIEKPKITIEALAARLKISTRAVKKHIHNLKKQRRLTRVGPDKGGYWKVTRA